MVSYQNHRADMVEMRRIELLSENHLSQLSPGAFRLLRFPSHVAGEQATCYGSSQVVTEAGTSLRSCAPLIDAFIRAAVFPVKTAALIRQQEQQYCCRLFFKFAAFKVVLHHYPLTETYSPRRNLYIPIYHRTEIHAVFYI